MSYNPTVWVSGDKITTEKLNKIEQGIVGLENGTGCFLVNVSSEGVCDKTAGQIKAAVLAGKQIVFKSERNLAS